MVWIVYATVLMAGCASVPKPTPLATATGPELRGPLKARQGFRTQLVAVAFDADGPLKPLRGFERVRYASPAGKLAAYLSKNPGGKNRYPAVVWAHGGFGGAGCGRSKIFRERNIVMLCPSWRGENDNPGRYEMFYGELDDALAAVRYLESVPYVDPDRIYFAGHSTGGTISLLVAASTSRVRAVFALGGAPDMRAVVADGGYGNTPFDESRDDEIRLRSPIEFVNEMLVPTFYFEGAESGYAADAKRMAEVADSHGRAVHSYILAGGDHNIVEPVLNSIAQAIADDKIDSKFEFDAEREQRRFEHFASATEQGFWVSDEVGNTPRLDLQPMPVVGTRLRLRTEVAIRMQDGTVRYALTIALRITDLAASADERQLYLADFTVDDFELKTVPNQAFRTAFEKTFPKVVGLNGRITAFLNHQFAATEVLAGGQPAGEKATAQVILALSGLGSVVPAHPVGGGAKWRYGGAVEKSGTLGASISRLELVKAAPRALVRWETDWRSLQTGKLRALQESGEQTYDERNRPTERRASFIFRYSTAVAKNKARSLQLTSRIEYDSEQSASD